MNRDNDRLAAGTRLGRYIWCKNLVYDILDVLLYTIIFIPYIYVYFSEYM